MKHAENKKQHILAYDEHHHQREQHTPRLALKIMTNTCFIRTLPILIDDTDTLLRQPPQERILHSRRCAFSFLHIHHHGFQDRRVAYAPS